MERVRRPSLYSLAELTLIALIAVQLARLFWLLVTPLGPVGDWRPPASLTAPPTTARLGDFDPFFRLAGAGGPLAVTGLALRLYGTREDQATGRGSAIIALPDGVQSSYGVGEEIMPGVTLTAVAADNVTISRNGVMEQLFLDQSQPAPGAAGAAPQPVTAAPPQPIVAAPTPAAPPLQLQPRVSNNQITGLVVAPGGDGGQAFRAAGFAPGDVIVTVNGQRVSSADQAIALVRQAGGQAAVTVDRGGRAVQLTVRF
ncbi:type II secretion system protein N [Sphingosinicella sp.]|uniref:type II secretion system protein N n=1 Tax=Sphingosinicella sp. TaxID=1917971 RepID=UPI00403781B8